MKICLLAALVLGACFSSAFAQTPIVNAKKRTATININGNPNESIWEFTNAVTKNIVGTSNNTITYAVLWDSLYLYLAVKVTDANKFNDSANPWDDDAIEVYIDAENNGGTSYGVNDRQIMKEWNSSSIWEKNNKTTGITHGWSNITGGYAVEMRIPWSNIAVTNPSPGFTIGFDIANDDDDNGSTRESQRMWAGDSNNWQYTQNFGDLVLINQLDTQAPTAPSNLAASSITQSSLLLNWTASTDNVAVAGYDIYRDGVKLNSSLVTTATYNVTGLQASTAYSFYVIAKDAAGNSSANSNTINVTTPDTQAPTQPGNLAASAITQTTLTLTWTASTDNVAVAGYDVYRDGIKLNAANITGTTFNVTGLQASTSYLFFVQARDAAGNFTNSNTLNVTTPAPPDTDPPSAPGNLVTTNITQSTVTLGWDAATDNIAVTGYDVYRDGVKLNASLVTGLSYTANGLSALVSYDFYVVARDAAGNSSANSNIVNVVLPDTQAPTVPANLTASAITQTSMTISWTASTDNIGVTGYDIFRDGVKINASLLTSTSLDVTGLNNSTTYAFSIQAWDAAGNSSTSATSNFSTLAPPDVDPPSVPGTPVASNVTATTLTLTWLASTDNVAVTGYDVFRNGTKLNASPVAATTYNVTGLTASTAYTFYVRAMDAANNFSNNSNTLSLTTPGAPGCTGTGAINYQKWNNISGTSVSNLTSNANYPNNPSVSGTLTTFEIATNSGDNYGMKVYGYICPPATGNYTFWIASDDNGELWLSSSNSPSNKTRIAYHTQWTNSREWNKYSTQKSAAITLNAGQLYYVEALMKEGTGGDNLAVGWAKPGQATTAPSEVIPGSQLLANIPDAQAPTAPANLVALNIGQTAFLLNWSASSDNIGVAGYDVYRNGTKINSSLVTASSYNVSGLTANTLYSFYIIAKDAAGNSSAASSALAVSTLPVEAGAETFSQRTVIANQRMPHDLVYGPDNNIWYTERFAGKVSFVNPATGNKTVLLTLGSKMVLVSGQDGLMGLALHPQLLQGKPYVYISYTYESTSATVRKTRIERYTYDILTQTLTSPVTILENIPGSNDHNSARIAIGPDLKLYYTVGDMGAGQFDNTSRTNNAQNLSVYEGKVLRLNTEAIAGSWIPVDNPFTNAGQPTAVYSFGHRNPQGLVWGNVNGTDILYSSEHGPYSDDEVNIIEAGRNYGWPQVSGFCDGNYNGRTIGGFAVVSEQTNCATLNAKEPLRSLFPASNPPTGGDNMTWPSTGPSGTDFYGSNAIPGWQNSLLIAQLKNGTLTRFKLSSDGRAIISDTIHYFRGIGRFRDVVVSPDGLKIYLACDSSGSTSGPTGGVTTTPANPGSILEFSYQPVGGRPINQLLVRTATNKEAGNNNIDIYPNPVTSFVVVYNYGNEKSHVAELYDLNGKQIKKQLLLTLATRMEVGPTANGLYILKISDRKGRVIKTEKLVIQK
jgi:PQQ-dependent dehydrogenase (s-GDH family)